jgi:GNAT superfamily N-acetyltransferase
LLRAAHHDIKRSPMTTLAGQILHTALPCNMASDVSLQSGRICLKFLADEALSPHAMNASRKLRKHDMAAMLLPQGMPSMAPPTIRPARSDEYDEIARVWMDSWVSTGLEGASNFLLANLRARISREVERGWSLFVADDGGRLAAMLALRLPDGCLDQLFVAPDYQGKGLGKLLLAYARERMPHEIWLRCVRENDKAWRWYEREGFVFEKEEVNPITGFVMKLYRWKREEAVR